jgi:flagellar biosynthesis/type III secretory pathway protein FliH
MTTVYKDDFIDRYKAEGRTEGKAEGKAEGRIEGKAEGSAQMILRVLSARGMQLPADIRERILGCSDSRQLEMWGDRAATAVSLDDVFGA